METILLYGWPMLFAWVFADQAGIPIPVVPLLLGAGALAGGQRLSLSLAIALAVAASLVADLAWYAVGRRHDLRALGVLCRITLEPDSCLRRAQNLFLRHRLRALLIAKFLPGVNPLAAGLAGVLIGLGLPEDEAEQYQSEFNAGRTIVTVHAIGERYQQAQDILNRIGSTRSSSPCRRRSQRVCYVCPAPSWRLSLAASSTVHRSR